MANITYLLGAGASANAIPVVSGFKERIFTVKNILCQYILHGTGSTELISTLPKKIIDKNNILRNIVNEFDWLIEEASNHQTIDTLAKKYFLTNHEKLNRLKKILIIYFAIEQIGTLPDLRYDSFFASILKKDGKNILLAKNVKMISWNYDLQIELTLRKYINRTIEAIKEEYQIHPNEKSFDLINGSSINRQKFGVIKLNGNAFWKTLPEDTFPYEENPPSFFDKYPNRLTLEKYLGDLLDEYEMFFNPISNPHYLNHFNFAWESDKDYKQKYKGYSTNIDQAKIIAQETDILVIIGYSFPVFNREIDSLLMNQMTNVQKVYVQDVYPEKIKSTIENAFQSFQVPFSKLFQLESNINQFVIPYEL